MRKNEGLMKMVVVAIVFFALTSVALSVGAAAETEDYDLTTQTLKGTKEADLIVRVGDIDNLGFGWPQGFDVFSGKSTPTHRYPYKPEPDDPSGTDRIMVGTSYDGHPPAGQDGYTSTTSRPDNLPQPISMQYNLGGIQVHSAVLQMFVDDFQSPLWKSKFQVELNGQRAPFLEDVLNPLLQTGPIGKLITVQVPADFLTIIASGSLEISIDDPTTGAGDGFAIDFVRLLVNPHAFAHTGRVSGHVVDAETGKPIQGATVSASGVVSSKTDSSGAYTLENVPAGLAVVTASATGYISQILSKDLSADASVTLDFRLTKGVPPTPTPTPTPVITTPTPAPVITTPTPAPVITTPTPAPVITTPTPPVTAGIPQITISQTSLLAEPEVGEEAVITVTLRNAGDGIAKNIQLTERIPSSVSISYVDGADKAGNLVTWTGDLNPRESHSIQHTFKILETGDRFFTARVTFEDAAGNKRETSTEIYIMTERPPATPPITPTPTPPGFELAFAIVGLLAVAYLLRRRE